MESRNDDSLYHIFQIKFFYIQGIFSSSAHFFLKPPVSLKHIYTNKLVMYLFIIFLYLIKIYAQLQKYCVKKMALISDHGSTKVG